MNINKNDEFIVDIIDYGADGEGIAKIDGYTILSLEQWRMKSARYI